MAQLPEPTEKASARRALFEIETAANRWQMGSPGEQEVHVDAASNAKRPAVHVVHEEAPVEDDLPAQNHNTCHTYIGEFRISTMCIVLTQNLGHSSCTATPVWHR